MTRNEEPYQADPKKLDKYASEIKSASTLDELLYALREFEEEIDTDESNNPTDLDYELRIRGIELPGLPTFGGAEPTDTACIWSWDEDRLLAGTGAFREWQIEDRDGR